MQVPKDYQANRKNLYVSMHWHIYPPLRHFLPSTWGLQPQTGAFPKTDFYIYQTTPRRVNRITLPVPQCIPWQPIMKMRQLLPLFVLCLGLGACASANFYPHEGPVDSASAPRGGSHFVTDGLDVWFIGEPDRPYRILGYIENPNGAYIDDQHRIVDSSILKKAHEVGANALIEVVTRNDPDPFARGMFGDRHWGFAADWPTSTRQVARYTAIQYLAPSAPASH